MARNSNPGTRGAKSPFSDRADVNILALETLSLCVYVQQMRIILFLLLCPAAFGAELWVSPGGNDTNTGTKSAPFATITAARDAARKAADKQSTVWLAAGTYRVNATIEFGERDSGCTYRAAPGQEARLSGGLELDPSKFQPITDAAVLDRLPQESRGKVMQLDLRAAGISHIDPMISRGFGKPIVAVPVELIFNDRPMTLSRWPNGELATYANVIDPGSAPRLAMNDLPPNERKVEPDRGAVFVYTGDRPARWTHATDAWLMGYWKYGWADDLIQIASIDPAKKQIALKTPSFYGVDPNNRYYATNLLEEIDTPGEYFIDRDKLILYFCPPSQLAGSRIALTQLAEPMISIKNATNLRFENLIFEDTRANGIVVRGGSGDRIAHCTLRNIGLRAVEIGSDYDFTGGHFNGVSDCTLRDIGTDGIVLSAGDRKELTPGDDFADSNDISNVGRWYRQSHPAVNLFGVGNRASHNFIHDCVASAIMFWGNDMLIEFNDIARCVTDSDDAGAIYIGRNPSARGTIIRHNLFRDIGPNRVGNIGVFSIYFDDTCSGETVENNIFYRAGNPGNGVNATIYVNGGVDNRIENNILIDCPNTFFSWHYSVQQWKDFVASVPGVQHLRDEIDVTKPPYTTRYPELKDIFNPEAMTTHTNIERNNTRLPADPAFAKVMTDTTSNPDRARAVRAIPQATTLPVDEIGPVSRSVRYDPASLRANITRLIKTKDYRAAVALLNAADVDRQLSADGSGYIGIGGYSIDLPGAGPGSTFDRSRDWFVPGTSDVIKDREWQEVATEFARRYNNRRRELTK